MLSKKIITLSVLVIQSIIGFGQAENYCKYQAVLSYLRCDKKVNEKIKHFFPKLTAKKELYVELNISDRVDFLSITPFKTQLLEKEYFAQKELLKNDTLSFYNRYFFESYESEFLKKLIEPNDSKLYLTFSKPFDDYIIVEISDLWSKKSNYRFGKGMHILFRFNSYGLIVDVIYAGSTYG